MSDRQTETRGVVVIGSGNIGTDLLFKVLREPLLHCVGVIGIDPDSEGLAIARSKGIPTTDRGIEGLDDFSEVPFAAFDATTASAHVLHAGRLKERGIRSIDLTPAALGPMVVPDVNLEAHLDAPDINMISCAAQATIPIIAAVNRALGGVGYTETVSTVASLSAGPGTRQNIDEFTHKTRDALRKVGGASDAKAMAIFNPADPPIMMMNTVYNYVDDLSSVDKEAVIAEIAATAKRIRTSVPGYLVRGPAFDGERITTFVEVEGAGDYLPTYAGNLDIMTAAAVSLAATLAARDIKSTTTRRGE